MWQASHCKELMWLQINIVSDTLYLGCCEPLLRLLGEGNKYSRINYANNSGFFFGIQ